MTTPEETAQPRRMESRLRHSSRLLLEYWEGFQFSKYSLYSFKLRWVYYVRFKALDRVPSNILRDYTFPVLTAHGSPPRSSCFPTVRSIEDHLQIPCLETCI